MEPGAENQPAFDLSGGALCLDFANTIGDRPHCHEEKLGGFTELLRWSAEAGIVDDDQRDRLAREAARHPRVAGAFFRRAIELRERLYRIFSTLAAGERPGAADLDGLNRDLAAALRHLRVEPAGDGFAWSWASPGGGFDWLLWPVARAAGELLTSAEVELVRECASDRCSWLFVDRSRTHRRRWCDMKVCGNRAKARRHYQRTKRSAEN
jgi:predicted RNA-binding Zn ribbon-like protein